MDGLDEGSNFHCLPVDSTHIVDFRSLGKSCERIIMSLYAREWSDVLRLMINYLFNPQKMYNVAV